MEANNNTKSANCPICGNKASPLFSVPCDYRKPKASKAYSVYWCNQCTYGQVWKRPTKEEITGFYLLDDYYTHKPASTNAQANKMQFLDRLRTHIAWHLDRGEDLTPNEVTSLKKGNDLSILEIGCGNGKNLSKFLENGFSVFGVEPDPAARAVAIKAVVNVFAGTAEELPENIKSRKYDVILMSHVLEHCQDINAAVSNVNEFLKPGGICIVETPNCQSLGFRSYQGEWPWSDIPRHLNFFTPVSLKAILTKHDFNVVSTKYRGFYRQFTNSWLKNEEEIWLSFFNRNSNKELYPNFKTRAWKLLLKSILSSKAAKYDSVRLIAYKNK
jgi:SAM-dependent methyltransferase